MIDVLIPAYNAEKTILKTLGSLAMQAMSKLLDVYILDDGSDVGYEDIVKCFSNAGVFNSIWLFKNEKNSGIGFSRNEIIRLSSEHSNNPWIFFIDSDDYLYSPYTINKMVNELENNPEIKLLYTKVIQEMGDCSDTSYGRHLESVDGGCIIWLHGRLMHRETLKQTGLKFPTTRSNEDTTFNMALFHMLEPHEIEYCDFDAVCTNYNIDSITRSIASTRRSMNFNNPNENWDCYRGCLSTFTCLSNFIKSKGMLPTYSKCSNFVDRFLLMSMLSYADIEFLNDETHELYDMINLLYYRDIIVPIKKYSSSFSLSTAWIKNKTFLWGFKKGFLDFNKYIREQDAKFTQERFDELAKKYSTDDGYRK